MLHNCWRNDWKSARSAALDPAYSVTSASVSASLMYARSDAMELNPALVPPLDSRMRKLAKLLLKTSCVGVKGSLPERPSECPPTTEATACLVEKPFAVKVPIVSIGKLIVLVGSSRIYRTHWAGYGGAAGKLHGDFNAHLDSISYAYRQILDGGIKPQTVIPPMDELKLVPLVIFRELR